MAVPVGPTQDIIRKTMGDELPDFYNIVLERPRDDPSGYDVIFIDAAAKVRAATELSAIVGTIESLHMLTCLYIISSSPHMFKAALIRVLAADQVCWVRKEVCAELGVAPRTLKLLS